MAAPWESLAPRERDALVATEVMGLDVRGYALAYEDEMACWNIEHPNEPVRGRAEDRMAVYVEHDGLKDMGPLTWDDDKWGDDGPPDWVRKDNEETRRKFALDVDTWGHPREALAAVPPYSTDIACAWEVVEKMRETGPDDGDGGYVFSFGSAEAHVKAEPPSSGKWWCEILRLYDQPYISDQAVAAADTMPLAICLAALRAKGVEV